MQRSPSFKTFVVVSLVAHLMVALTLFVFENFSLPQPQDNVVSIELIPSQAIPEQVAGIPAEKPKKIPHALKNQIVEQDSSRANDEAPTDTRFLSEKNQTVKKQTMSANRGDFQNVKKASSDKAGAKGDGKEKHETLAKNLLKGFDPNAAMEKRLADQAEGKGLGKAERDSDNAGKGSDVSQSNDYVKDVDRGLETMLNTREFKYYSYYNRIRRQLSQHWEGRVREKLSKLFREGRAPAATGQDRVTKLMIVLNEKGTLVRVQVMSDSGVRDLDDAAIEAFRAAAPFPNPPQGIVEQDGTVKIRWDFVLEV